MAFEEKMKYKIAEFGGQEGEAKFKSSGDVDYKIEMNFPKVSFTNFLPNVDSCFLDINGD